MTKVKFVLAVAFCFSLLSCATTSVENSDTHVASNSTVRKPAEQADFFEFETGSCTPTSKCSVILTKSENIRLFKGGNALTGTMYQDGVSFHCNELNLDGTLFSHDGQLIGIKWSDGKIWGDITGGHPGYDNLGEFLGSWNVTIDTGHTGNFSGSWTLNIRRDGVCDGNGFPNCSWEMKDEGLVIHWDNSTRAVIKEKHDDVMTGPYFSGDTDSGAFRATRITNN